MFNKQEVRQQIIQYFRSVGSGENIVQAIKQALFLNENFSPLLLFELISHGKQKITREDWKKYLIDRNISFSDQQIRYFFRHNHFRQQITLNQFLEAMIPYNADVIRQFKAKYLDSLEISQLDPEVQFILAELMSNWIGFFRNLIKIRSELSRVVSRRQIQHLVKQDLVLHSKPRQARKFHQSFQQRNFDVSFHELRKFLQLWVSSKQLLHEFCLLNVKRHIKCQNPFQKIVYRHKKHKKSKSRSISASASRSVSRRKSPSQSNRGVGSTENKRSKRERQPNVEKDSNSENDYQDYVLKQKQEQRNSPPPRTKYDQYKRQLKVALEKQVGYSRNEQLNRNNIKSGDISNRQRRYFPQNNLQNQTLQRNIRNQQYSKQKQYQKNQQKMPQTKTKAYKKNNEGQLIVKIFEQIVLKQDRLQKLRKQLVKSTDFNIINLFKIIDSSNKGYITKSALQTFVDQSGSGYEALIAYYSREFDKLRLQEFGMIFRPLSKQLNESLDKRPQHKIPNPFKKQTMRLIIQIIRLEAEMHSNINNIKNKIKQAGISFKSLFQYIDLESQGFITSQNLRELLEESNIHCEAKDIKCLMKLFRKKIDERISLNQFLSFMDF